MVCHRIASLVSGLYARFGVRRTGNECVKIISDIEKPIVKRGVRMMSSGGKRIEIIGVGIKISVFKPT